MKLGLRLRVFLFFAALAVGTALVMGLALWVGARKAQAGGNGYAIASVIAGFGVTGLIAGIWLLFDENVAKPIERLATDLRARAEAGIRGALDEHALRYLGDLAPAAQALNQRTLHVADAIATATGQLEAEKKQLCDLLSEMPVATIMVSADHRIVLYDRQATALLRTIAQPCLGASIFDYFDGRALRRVVAGEASAEAFDLTDRAGHVHRDVRLRRLGEAGGYILTLDAVEETGETIAARALTFDFGLMDTTPVKAEAETALVDLTFTVFDTETTGLDPERDALIQIGAVRIVRGRLIDGETFDELIDPGRPIPPVSTNVHGITDAMVGGAPKAEEVCERFKTFSRDSVLVAHNAPFDWRFLNRVTPMGRRVVLDTVLISAILYGTTDQHSLDALCERLHVNIPEEERHTGLGDALATARVLEAAIPMLKARGICTLGELQAESGKFGRLLKTVADSEAETV
ncbi:3'-5' exonuclease [Roseovarius aestuariivivens]|uniref:3'-5' exonuclease n=1 Tax=Roseovarius aestuariivivens TaxID=1888910 RepID=UPI0010817742|nr:exonuclease domain-containing protein [Roseovarius aestuariivivens]